MTEKTAEKYNELLEHVNNPLHLHQCDVHFELQGGTTEERKLVLDWVESERQRVEPDAIRAEIVAAAQEGRKARTFTCPGDLLGAGQMYGGHRSAAGIVLRIIRPGLDAELARRNAIAVAEYERYRQACIQGVALPPQ